MHDSPPSTRFLLPRADAILRRIQSEHYASALIEYCEGLRDFPHRAVLQDVIRPGLRLTNYKSRAIVAYIVEGKVVPSAGGPQRVDLLLVWRYRLVMESKLADHAEQQLIEAARRLSPAQRLAAFVEHSRLVQELQRSGEQVRESNRARRSRESS